MKLSANDLLNLKIIDEIIPEPLGGAHRDKNLILENVRNSIERSINEFNTLTREEVYNKRKGKVLVYRKNERICNKFKYTRKFIITNKLNK